MLRVVLFALLALVIIAALVIGGAIWWFDRSIRAEVQALQVAARVQTRIVTEADLAGLPPPVQRYLRASGVVGTPIPSVIRIIQTGRLRGSLEAEWMSFEAEQTYTTDPPGFVWRAWFPSRAAPIVMGRDQYDGNASILMRMLGLLPVADESGEDIRPAALMRYLNEMMWFPAAYVGDNITWRAIDDRSAEVMIADRGLSVSGIVFFDETDMQINFRAPRYNTSARSIETWETPISAHRDLDGLILPESGAGVWQQPGGPFAYIELDVTSVTYE